MLGSTLIRLAGRSLAQLLRWIYDRLASYLSGRCFVCNRRRVMYCRRVRLGEATIRICRQCCECESH
ncbi:hypothetical protein Ddc_10494 [Ditylenchus destructor]|nr:hypothetical protein Ddc_10494 [Ditylenchus destructor]